MSLSWALLLLGTAAQTPDSAGVQDRIPWTSSVLRGNPDPPAPYRTENAFPHLKFEYPVDLVAVPGTDSLAVAEREGSIRVFKNRPDVCRSELLAQLEGEIFGIAFHPRFGENGFLYVMGAPKGKALVQVLRLRVARDGSGETLPPEAQTVLRWPCADRPFQFGGSIHFGGALRFGPEGFLYIGVGDGSAGTDTLATGQDLGDFFGSVLRIDIDRAPAGRHYDIPRDNPFATRRGARPEIWAYGLRQPWKMNFDVETGELWLGDVGQDLWEPVYKIRRGCNCGWSVREGGHPYRPDRAAGPEPFLAPVVVHPHTEFRALIGGLVYRGSRLPELAGSYIYGDHNTGRIWELRLEHNQIARNRELAVLPGPIVGFGEDARKELYVLQFLEGSLHRLVQAAEIQANPSFPRQLSRTGLFASVPDHRPAPGVHSYEVNAPLWSDGAAKERFIALPEVSRIRFEAFANSYVPALPPSWDFPDGTVLVKTFSLEGESGKPRRVETRLLLLHKKSQAPDIRDQSWRGYSYRWNAEQTDAELVGSAGEDQDYEVRDPAAESGHRRVSWHFPSRSECLMCHTQSAHFVLGVTTPQMNREIEVPGRGRMNQLKWLAQQGLFAAPLPKPPADLPRLASYDDPHESLERRARSYLQANCSHCHANPPGGYARLQLLALGSLADSGLVDVSPDFGSLGLPEARLIAAGAPERSLIHYRMGLTGPGRMPPLASRRPDQAGLQMLADWIRSIPPGAPPDSGGHPALLGLGAAFLVAGMAVWRWKRGRAG